MGRVSTFEASNPMGEMNTTPLIDVLLVLLVMLIMTIPPQTHAVKFDLSSSRAPIDHIRRDSNLLTIAADGTLRWNGAVIDRERLRSDLSASRQMVPSPELHLQPDAEARHGEVDEILAIIKREQVSRFGFVGNERYLNTF